MLLWLIRAASAAIVALVALIAGVHTAASDLDGLPDSDYYASVELDSSPLSREQVVVALDAYADTHAIDIVRVASSPDDFLNTRTGYMFGSETTEQRRIDWFSPTMHGDIVDADRLGATSLEGAYALYGDGSVVEEFASWAESEIGAAIVLQERSQLAMLQYALLTVGAWVPVSAALLLLVASVLAWYVLRARARELRMLGGMRLTTITLSDLGSLFLAFAVPAAIGVAVTIAAVTFGGFGRVIAFLGTMATMLAITAGSTIVLALIVASATLPNVDDIAARQPSERASWGVSEAMKAIATVVAAALVPTVVATVVAAAVAASQSSTWSRFGDAVSVRIGSGLIDGSADDDLGSLAEDAAQHDGLLFSAPLTSGSMILLDEQGVDELHELGYDGIAIANPEYLDTSGADSLVPVDAYGSIDDLPASIANLQSTLALWTDSGDSPRHEIMTTVDGDNFVAFAGREGTFELYARPLILVVEDMTEFNATSLTSFMSSDNIVFTDSTALAEGIADRGLDDVILSIDRAADLGLYDAQTKARNAQLGSVAIGLAALGLVMSIAVTAWVFAILRRRRWFVERTAGRTWGQILAPRMLWELAVASLLGATLAFVLMIRGTTPLWIAALAVIGYLAISWLLHWWAGVATFRASVERKA